MERVVFLIEDTGERIPCLLNPESLVLRRTAGVRARRSIGGPLTGVGRSDDPLLHTGGGRTELLLDLLFDVSLVTGPTPVEDVRNLTGRLWELAENASGDDGYGRLRVARFIWGRSFNIPGVVTAVAERLEHFTTEGTARRSWLRMRFVRVAEPSLPTAAGAAASPFTPEGPGVAESATLSPEEAVRFLEVGGAAPEEADEATSGGEPTRPDNWAALALGDSTLWRWIFARTPVDDPLGVPAGTVLEVPAAPSGEESP